MTVALADGAANAVPALAALRDLMRPPDAMMTIELVMGDASLHLKAATRLR